MTLFMALYGRDPPLLIRVWKGRTPVDSLDEEFQLRDVIRDALRLHMLKAQLIQKSPRGILRKNTIRYCGRAEASSIQTTIIKRPFEEFSPHSYAPYKILQRVGQVAYKLNLPPQTKIKLVFHVSQLKQIKGAIPSTSHLATDLIVDLEMQEPPLRCWELEALHHGYVTKFPVSVT